MARLTMMDYFKDRPTFINGAYWGCKGATRSSAHIALVAPNNDIIELQRNIDIGETRKFKTGHSVRVTNVLLSGRSTYADVVVTGIVTPLAPEVPEIPAIPEPLAPGEICTEAYNTDLVIKIPNKDGSFKSYTYNVYIPPVCTPIVPEPPAPPVPPTPPVCTEGDLAGEITCWDGSKIHTLVCKNNVFVPTGMICPPLVQAKTVKILTTAGYNLPNAYVGKTVEIIAAVMCGLDKSDGEYALLTLDGTPIAEGRTGGGTLGPGFVSFKWTVTGKSGPRKLCVRVPKSDVCPNYSEATDCKIMMVSSVPPSIAEQLELERRELRERLELIRFERKFMRKLPKRGVGLPGYVDYPPVTIPELEYPPVTIPELEYPPVTIPELEYPPVTIPETVELEERAKEFGTIIILYIPIPEKLNRFPVSRDIIGYRPGIPYIPTPEKQYILPTVSIDNTVVGCPPINVDVVPGKHTIKVELKGLAPIYKTVTVEPDKVLTITDLSFI